MPLLGGTDHAFVSLTRRGLEAHHAHVGDDVAVVEIGVANVYE